MRQARQRTDTSPFFPSFVWASALFALFAGFLLGGLIFLLRAIGRPAAGWQIGAIQAHGHIQIFGWGGLMVLGVGLHFLPRLLSVPNPYPNWPRSILVLMSIGLLFRVLSQPILVGTSLHWLRSVAAAALALSGVTELVASLLTVMTVALILETREASRKTGAVAGCHRAYRRCLRRVSCCAVRQRGWNGSSGDQTRRGVISASVDRITIILGLSGFLVAISLAMSARLFPLYIQAQLPRERWLRSTAALLFIGLSLRAIGVLVGRSQVDGVGQILTAVAFLCGIVALRVVEPRRQLPRRPVRVFSDPLQLHVICAYAWLAVAATFTLIDGLDVLGYTSRMVPVDAQRHSLGAGFVTLLILGVGQEMLPGLVRQPLRWKRARWLTLLLANGAALARVVPLLNGTVFTTNTAVMSAAGLLGALAIAVFLANVPLRIRPAATARNLTSTSA